LTAQAEVSERAEHAPARPSGRRDGAGLLAPLRRSRVFRVMWSGHVTMQLGIWVLTVAGQWYMVDAGQSTLMVALVQAAVTVPFLVLGVPAGVLADLLPRRTLMVATNFAATAVGLVLVAASLGGFLTPIALLVLTILLGVAQAINQATWSASVPDIVEPELIPSASMLASISVNLGRVLGPAIGGVLIVVSGATSAFAVSGAAFLFYALAGLAAANLRRPLRGERFTTALRTGFAHVVHSADQLRLLAITAGWFVAGSAFFAVLPVIAMRGMGEGAAGYGFMLAVAGGGAVGGTVLLAPLRRRLSNRAYSALLIPAYAASLVVVALSGHRAPILIGLAVAGFTWTAVGSTLMATHQVILAPWVRARALSYHLVASQGGMAVGSYLWGAVGDRIGGPAVFCVAAAAMAPVWLLVMLRWLPRPKATGDPVPWAEPPRADAPGRRHVLVMVEYRVEDADREAFLELMRQVRRSRRRTGARRWRLFADPDRDRIFVEAWTVASWEEHVLQHVERQTEAEARISRAVRELVGPPVRVVHLVEHKT
jgi:MFS family permease